MYTDDSTINLCVGESKGLPDAYADLYFQNTSPENGITLAMDYMWSVEDTSCAEIVDNKVKAIKVGTTYLTTKILNQTLRVPIEVVSEYPQEAPTDTPADVPTATPTNAPIVTPTPKPASTNMPIATPTSTPTEAPASGCSTYYISASFGQTEARRMLGMVNEFRTGDEAWYWNSTNTEKIYNTDLKTLTYDYELERVAMKRAMEIAVAFSHTRPNGEICFTAYPDTHRRGSTGENIAVGQTTVEKAFIAWQETDCDYSGQGHRRNMLGKGYTSIGIGHVVYHGCDYWAMELSGRVVDETYVAPDDSEAIYPVEIASRNIKDVVLTPAVDEIRLKVNERTSVPALKCRILYRSRERSIK